MSFYPGKGRFTVNTLLEGDKIEVIVDIQKPKNLEEDEPDPPAEKKIPKVPKIRSERQAASIELFPDQDNCQRYESINTSCLTVFHELMKTKYIEMINFHREEMLDYIKKDLERQEKIKNLLSEIASWTKENYRLEQENAKLRKTILDKEKK